jgi:protein required for attachment to host cells
MKPVVTWVVMANARSAKVIAHRGLGKGLCVVSGKTWNAPEVRLPHDKAGIGHSSVGPGVAAVEQTDPQDVSDARFAKNVMDQVAKAHGEKQFERLILIAGPHMLGLLRTHLDPALRAALVGELPKDLSSQPLSAVEAHLGELIAI